MQTLSADGARYSDGEPSLNNDETFVFWNKGNGALVLENNEEKSYIGCIQVAPDPGGLTNVYGSGSKGFSIRYPEGYIVNPNYVYLTPGQDKEIRGVSFTVSPSMVKGTNLSQDSYISVEEIPDSSICAADLFLKGDQSGNVTEADKGTTYSIASSTGAGAGNRYEETLYAVSGTNPCIAIRYSIHYGVMENYPKGAVQAFDEKKLLEEFDAIRRTLIVSQ